MYKISQASVLLVFCLTCVACCLSDGECDTSEYCSRNLTCIHIPVRLGDPCRSDVQCEGFDTWSKCLNGSCHCPPPYVDRHGTCYCDGTVPGATVSLVILLYTLIPIGILISIAVAIVCTLRWRTSLPSSPSTEAVPSPASDARQRSCQVSYTRRTSRSLSSIETRRDDRGSETIR